MTATYRLVHLSPDPFSGTRLVLGAVVSAEGEVRIAKVKHPLGAESLGRADLAVLARMLSQRLDEIVQPDALPPVFGPLAMLGESRPLPATVMDPVAWLEEQVLNLRRAGESPLRPSHAPHRAKVGLRFFETARVERFVRRNFAPATHGRGWLATDAAGMEPITHWVGGREETLLMEPIVPARSQCDADLREVSTRFVAYRYAIEKAERQDGGQLIAYVLQGGTTTQRERALGLLSGKAHLVVDTSDEGERQRFIDRVREVGQSGERQQSLQSAVT